MKTQRWNTNSKGNFVLKNWFWTITINCTFQTKSELEIYILNQLGAIRMSGVASKFDVFLNFNAY